MSDSIYLHGLNLLPNFGPTRLGLLWDYFKDWEKAYKANSATLKKAGIEPNTCALFSKLKDKTNLEYEYKLLKENGVQILTVKDTGYPTLLKQIPKFPYILYYKGNLGPPDELCIAVVGTRRITNYGRTVTPYLIEPLVKSGATIVSGLAFGVDAQAQKISVDNNKRTIAVLGGGLDNKSIYPKHHQLLAQQILENNGLLLSEYPIGTPSLKQHFIARNRIISGISLATVIIECNLKSGSLITAKYALEQNRQVFAVPGPIYSEMSKGPNNLIKMGAKPVTDANDILEELNIVNIADSQVLDAMESNNPLETKILSQLSFDPLNVNKLIQILELDAQTVISTLTFLEMKGRVKNLGAQQYIKCR